MPSNRRGLLKKITARLVRIRFVHRAVTEKADLSAFRQRPSVRTIFGVGTIILSYIIGWPLIAVLGVVSIYLQRPAIVLVGGPVAYGISHLVFLLGMYLAGARYSWIFLRWLTRVAMDRLMRATDTHLPPLDPEN